MENMAAAINNAYNFPTYPLTERVLFGHSDCRDSTPLRFQDPLWRRFQILTFNYFSNLSELVDNFTQSRLNVFILHFKYC